MGVFLRTMFPSFWTLPNGLGSGPGDISTRDFLSFFMYWLVSLVSLKPQIAYASLSELSSLAALRLHFGLWQDALRVLAQGRYHPTHVL